MVVKTATQIGIKNVKSEEEKMRIMNDFQKFCIKHKVNKWKAWYKKGKYTVLIEGELDMEAFRREVLNLSD